MEKVEKKPLYKKWWFWVIVAFVGSAAIAGIAESGNKKNTNNMPSTSASDKGQSDNGDESSESTTRPHLKLQGEVMAKAAKWDDVEEISVRVNEDLGNDEPDDYIVLIDAMYMGKLSAPHDTLQSYCNEAATVLELSKIKANELAIFWKGNNGKSLGKCHYHRNGQTMVFDDESAGIFLRK